MKSTACLVSAIAALASSAFAGNVLVVGPLPTRIAEIQAAVDAAIDGDVILVKSGTYATFSVPNRTVTIVADTGQSVNVDGAIRVRNLDAGRTVVVSGLHALGRATPDNAVTGNGFFATNCAGSIRVRDCQLRGYVGTGSNLPCPMTARAGAELLGCGDVAFLRCTLVGAELLDRYLTSSPGQSDTSRMGPGLTADGDISEWSVIVLTKSAPLGQDRVDRAAELRVLVVDRDACFGKEGFDGSYVVLVDRDLLATELVDEVGDGDWA